MLSNHLILCCWFSLACNFSQHHSLFQWVGSLHQVAKVLELQFQQQSFQWLFRVDFLSRNRTYSAINLGSPEVKWNESCLVMSNSLWSHGLYNPWNSPGQNTGVGRLSLLQDIFPIQGSNPDLPHCRWILYQLSQKGSLAGGADLEGCLLNVNIRTGLWVRKT